MMLELQMQADKGGVPEDGESSLSYSSSPRVLQLVFNCGKHTIPQLQRNLTFSARYLTSLVRIVSSACLVRRTFIVRARPLQSILL